MLPLGIIIIRRYLPKSQESTTCLLMMHLIYSGCVLSDAPVADRGGPPAVGEAHQQRHCGLCGGAAPAAKRSAGMARLGSQAQLQI